MNDQPINNFTDYANSQFNNQFNKFSNNCMFQVLEIFLRQTV